MKFIHNIDGTIKHSNLDISIDLQGRNLLIAGGNGSGKTSLLSDIFISITNLVNYKQIPKIKDLERQIDTQQKAYDNAIDQNDKLDHKNMLNSTTQQLKQINDSIPIRFNDLNKLLDLKEQRKAIIRLFPADRKSIISSPQAASGVKLNIHTIDLDNNLGTNLEQHLVNLKVRSALDFYKSSKTTRAQQIENWFSQLTESLKYLFENESTELIFNPDTLKFKIKQVGKVAYDFQSLSSGYTAIFDIYADLLMRTEYLNIIPDQLEGVVLIDELDAHLHVSLQRKIFPFFSKSFPKIQFIITTHSPFVLTSVDDALIYDLTTNRTCEDLSMYSFETVLQGLLGVPPVSKQFEETIKKLIEQTSTKEFDIAKAEETLRKIEPHVDKLDSESEAYYYIAENRIINAKTGN